jgi:peptidoglycan hydrolase-like protein with peptidoglycan-binding domain
VNRRRLLIGLTVAVAGGVGTGVKVATASQDKKDTPSSGVGASDLVVDSDLQARTTVSGTLRYAGKRTIRCAQSGVLTAVRAAGTVITTGKRLYAVNNVPVFLLRGLAPAWRDFAAGMDAGPDVLQLERNLRSMGYLDRTPDRTFTGRTADAIKAWQKAEGLKRTGELPLGSLIFTSGDLRIGNVTAHLGDQVGPGTPVFDATATTRIVEADVQLADQSLAVVGHRVGLGLPDGQQTTGTISSVGAPTQKGSDTILPVVITLARQGIAPAFQEASVTVSIPSQLRRNVLSVPAAALLAIDPQRFGVEIVGDAGTTHVTPVTIGLFAGGRVEVSGAGLAAGQRVVVPQR